MKAQRITAAGINETIDIDLSDDNAIIEIVGGYFDQMKIGNSEAVMYMNCIGAEIGLPHNAIASEIFGYPIVGDVIVS